MDQRKLSRVPNMKYNYKFRYDKHIKDYIIISSNAKTASVKYLINKDNHYTWEKDEFKEYQYMLEWVLENYPEWTI